MSDEKGEFQSMDDGPGPLGEPEALWDHFWKLTKIPRCSKHEEMIWDFVVGEAGKLGLSCVVDEAGNVLIRKAATAGREDAKGLILQGHIDMVCEKNEEVAHDFSRDPLRLRTRGDYLYATDTTLGADNGVGAAAMLAVMESDSIEHGPLEFLFTIDEETGLTGAFQIKEELLRYRRMLNLDTEEEGAIYVGCAGGADSTVHLPVTWEDAGSGTGVQITVTGLLGGHSGVDIHTGRANSNLLLARVLKQLSRKVRFRLQELSGGTKRNAIPRQSRASLLIMDDQLPIVGGVLENCLDGFRSEFTVEPGIRLESRPADEAASRCLDEASTEKVLDLLMALPHGVQAMSQDIPDLVETSTNLAIIDLSEKELLVYMNSRSSVASALDWALDHIESIAELAGAGFKKGGHYPGWKPDLSSELLAIIERAHEDVLGERAEIKAIHAGLETGIIGEKFPGMEMVSIGPQIEHPHSPMERVKISSVRDFWRFLLAVLERC